MKVDVVYYVGKGRDFETEWLAPSQLFLPKCSQDVPILFFGFGGNYLCEFVQAVNKKNIMVLSTIEIYSHSCEA
jgi:hypothetical protein